MSNVRKHLTVLFLFTFFVATGTLISPTLMLRGPPFPALANLTGLRLGNVSRAQDVAISFKMYIIALLYLHGALVESRAIRTGAMMGNALYALGAVTTIAKDPQIEGGVTLAFTAAIYAGFAAIIAADSEKGDVAGLFGGVKPKEELREVAERVKEVGQKAEKKLEDKKRKE